MRLRFQIPAGILVAAVIPYLIRFYIDNSAGAVTVLNHTLIGTAVAIAFGAWLIRNVGNYPGAEAISATLTSISGAFISLLIFFVFTRISYNRVTLVASFFISLLWFSALALATHRQKRLRIGILPFGNVQNTEEFQHIQWRVLNGPDDDIDDLDAVTADLRVDLPSEWDRRLADYALSWVPVYHFKHLVESLSGRVELEHLSENSFGTLAPRQDYMILKRCIDWIVALIAGIVLMPLLVVIGILVRLSSPGPALFRQERIGYQGRPFIVYKFRTMKIADPNASEERDLAITRDGDSRVTSLGRFLRMSRIDELPQLLNVLKGEMSWIGPRPEAAVLSRWYEAEIPFYRYRHIVRPGIAGWAQVCQGHVADVHEVRSKLHYDFYYIKHYSLWIDMLIVLRTIRTMVTGYGAR